MLRKNKVKKRGCGNTSRMLFYTEHARVPKTFVHLKTRRYII